jgi:imidazolonepropionase-like amidohydrolase
MTVKAWVASIGLIACLGLGGNTIAAEREHASRQIAIIGARIYPSPDAAPIDDGVVIIRGDRIVGVGPRSRITVPRSARRIEAHGAVLTAGFWNSHIHLMPPELLNAATAKPEALQAGLDAMLTRWGFTSVFDIASATENALALRARINSGEVIGPMLLTVGAPFYPKDGTPIYVREYLKAHGMSNAEVSTPEEAAGRAAQQLDSGTDGVKLFAGAIVPLEGKISVLPMRVDIAKAVVEEAHRRGKPAFAHPSNLAGLNVAIDSGVDILAHTTAMDGGGPAGWSADLIARLRARNMALIPTMTLFEVEAKKFGGSPESLARTVKMITAEVHDYAAAGGQILFGTDVGYTDAYDTSEEYRLMSAALDWRQILAALTTAPASRFGFAARKGRIAVGMDADLVLLNGDPAQDPTAFARVRDTILAGRVIWGADR